MCLRCDAIPVVGCLIPSLLPAADPDLVLFFSFYFNPALLIGERWQLGVIYSKYDVRREGARGQEDDIKTRRKPV